MPCVQVPYRLYRTEPQVTSKLVNYSGSGENRITINP